MTKIWHGDCLELMKKIPDKSIDMILCDLPYGTTACKWDTVIPFEPLWEQYNRIIKDNGPIVLTAAQPFTSALVSSNFKMYRHHWVWDKIRPSGHLIAKYRPMMVTEDIIVFSKKTPVYNPQMIPRPPEKYEIPRNYGSGDCYTNKGEDPRRQYVGKMLTEWFPRNLIREMKRHSGNKNENFHPSQKPVPLFEYLIKTYSNEGDTVLDNCAGCGTTGVACKNLNRECILIEREEKYIEIIQKRLSS